MVKAHEIWHCASTLKYGCIIAVYGERTVTFTSDTFPVAWNRAAWILAQLDQLDLPPWNEQAKTTPQVD